MKKLLLIFSAILLAGSMWADNYLPGTWNGNFTLDEVVKFDANGSLTLQLGENQTYSFKMVLGSDWYGNNGTMTVSNCTGWVFNTSDGNCQLTTNKAGFYIFTLDENAHKLSVTYAKYYLAGNWNGNFDINGNVQFINNTVTLHLEAAKLYDFKFYNAEANTWSGNEGAMMPSNCTGWEFNKSANARIVTTVEGDYTFNLAWNNSTPIISATYPTGDVNYTAWAFTAYSGTYTLTENEYSAVNANLGTGTIKYYATSGEGVAKKNNNEYCFAMGGDCKATNGNYTNRIFYIDIETNGKLTIVCQSTSCKMKYFVTNRSSELTSIATSNFTDMEYDTESYTNTVTLSTIIGRKRLYFVAPTKSYIRYISWVPTGDIATESNITYTNTKGANTSELPQTYFEGEGVESFAALEDVEGFHFTGWSPASISASATGAQTITAQWEEVEETIGEAYKAEALAKDDACNYDGTLFKMVCSSAKVAIDKSNATSADGLTFTKAFLPSGTTTATSNTYSLTAKKKLSKIEVYYTCTDGSFTSKDQSKSGNLIYQIGNADAVTSTTNVDKSNKTAYKEVIAPQGGIDINTVVKIYSSANRLAIFSVVAYEYHELTLVAQNTAGYWATFSSDKAVEFEDATVYTVTANGSNIELQEVTSKQVPANTGVLLKSSSTSATFNYINSADALEENMLHPASEAMTGSYTFYKLAYNDYQNKTDLGFYWGADNGGAFTCKAGTAYLAVPVTSAPARTRFVLDQTGTATDVEAVEAQEEVVKFFENGQLLIKKNGVVYNVMGQVVR